MERIRQPECENVAKERRNLIYAIESQDEDYINKLTTINFDINETHPDFGNPVRKAARIGNFKIFKKLIELGADIHQPPPATELPILYESIESGNLDIIKYLIENGIDVNARWDNNCSDRPTALHYAINFERKEVVTLLLENNADVNSKCTGGTNPIALAILRRNFDAMDALINYDPDLFWPYTFARETYTNFHLSAAFGDWIVIYDWLFEFADTIDVNNNNNINLFTFFQSQTLLHFALSRHNCDRDVVDYLLNVGVDVNILDSKNKLAVETKRGLEVHLDSMSIVKHHIVKLIAAGFYLCDRNIKAVSTGEFNHYLAKCNLEVDRMKKNKIEGSNITFIEVLHKNMYYLAPNLKSVDLMSILKREPSEPIFPEYPIYDHMLFYKLLRVFKRVSYMKDCEKLINNIFYELQLPYTFIRKLYFYLSNNDLEKIIQPSHEKKRPRYLMNFQRRTARRESNTV